MILRIGTEIKFKSQKIFKRLIRENGVYKNSLMPSSDYGIRRLSVTNQTFSIGNPKKCEACGQKEFKIPGQYSDDYYAQWMVRKI